MNHLQLFKQTNITRCLVSEFYERGNGLRFFYNLLWFTSWKDLQIWETLAYDCTFYTCHVPWNAFRYESETHGFGFLFCSMWICEKKIGHDFCPLWKTSLGGRAGRSFLKPFLKVSSQNFPHYFTWSRWLRKYPIFFQPIIVQNYDVSFAMVLHFFNRCYTWTALRSANQNRAFFFMYIIRVVMRIICIEFLQFKFFIIIFIIDP